MKTVTPAVKAALREQHIRVAFLFNFTLDGVPLRMWSGSGNLQFEGGNWWGMGQLGQAQVAADSVEVKTLLSQYTLTGPSNSFQAENLLDFEVRGDVATYRMAVLDDKNQIIPDPIILDQSIMDTLSLKVSDTNEETIVLTGTSAIFDFARPLNTTISNESQIAAFAGDTGFDRIPGEVVDKVVKWTRT